MQNNQTKELRKVVQEKVIQAIKLFVGLGLLVLVIHKTGLDSKEAINKIISANRMHLLIAFVFLVMSQILGVKRWQVLSNSLGMNVGFIHCAKLHFLGLFSSTFLTSMGGDVVKAYYLVEGQKRKSYLSVMLDRYIGLVVMVFVASITAFALPKDDFHNKLSYGIWFIFFGLVSGGIFGLIFSDLLAKFLKQYNKEDIAEKLQEVNFLTKSFFTSYYVVTISLILSVVSQGFAILSVHQLSLAVGAVVDAGVMFVVVPIVMIVSVIPISPGGLGTREAVFVYLLTRVYTSVGIQEDFARSASALVAFLWLAINILVSLPGALIYLRLDKNKIKQQLEEKNDMGIAKEITIDGKLEKLKMEEKTDNLENDLKEKRLVEN